MKKLLRLFVFVIVIVMLFSLVACQKDDATDKTDTKKTETKEDAPKADSDPKDAAGAPKEGADTNNGRPYNLEQMQHDTRADRYLTGINATILPITEDDVTLAIWRGFSSTVMQGWDESAVFQAMEERTGVKIEWLYPPVGSETDNYNLRISSDDLPHIFSVGAPKYKGGHHKAVEDEVYIELTEYYDAGLMPNIKWLREDREDLNRDFIDDEGKMFFFPMIDIVPSDPWSGIWVREDMVNALGLGLPETIEDYDVLLRAMRDEYNIAPLGMNIDSWYGVNTNYMFAGSYETGYEFFHIEGEAQYGPILPGYKEWLTKMNVWYTEGLLDPDFATIDFDTYKAKMADGSYGVFGMAYGDVGQLKLTGAGTNPDYKLKPVLSPTSYDGQEIHLHQDNSTVRSDREFFTVRLVDEGLAEIAVMWKDYWYSQDGGDLCSYGPEGISYEWQDDGEYKWIHESLTIDEDADFWTVYPLFKLHNWGYLRNSEAYENEPEVFECIRLWDTQDSSWLVPDNISHTPDESDSISDIMTDINTLRDEVTLQFIIGSKPLSEFDAFVEQVKSMGIDEAIAIKSAAVQRYNAR